MGHMVGHMACYNLSKNAYLWTDPEWLAVGRIRYTTLHCRIRPEPKLALPVIAIKGSAELASCLESLALAVSIIFFPRRDGVVKDPAMVIVYCMERHT